MRFALKVIGIFIVCIFAGIGVTVTVVYFGMQQGMLNVRGSIMERNASFGPVPNHRERYLKRDS